MTVASVMYGQVLIGGDLMICGTVIWQDKHSRKGLEAMVQRRKRLLKYLRRTDWDSYSLVLSKLGLRDNPGYKNA